MTKKAHKSMGTIFTEASRAVDTILPTTEHNSFRDAIDLVEELLSYAQEHGFIESHTMRKMGAVAPTTDKQKYWIKGPHFDVRYSGRRTKPSADFVIELRRDKQGYISLAFDKIGVENEALLRGYARTAKKQNVTLNPPIFKGVQEDVPQEYIKRIAENLIYAARAFEAKAQRRSTAPEPGTP